MLPMAKKKPGGKRYPSRDNTKYVGLPLAMWRVLKAVGQEQERSASYMARKAVQAMLEALGRWPLPPEEKDQ
jgi:hypothetical protein